MITLEIATPDRLLIRETVQQLEVPGANGQLGILPGHAAVLSELGSGELTYTLMNGQKRFAAINGGWLEVLNDNVRVLADRAEFADEIDTARAEASLKRAMERLASQAPALDVARAINAMKRAQARLEAARHAGVLSKR